jgi:hypothetical protein
MSGPAEKSALTWDEIGDEIKEHLNKNSPASHLTLM